MLNIFNKNGKKVKGPIDMDVSGKNVSKIIHTGQFVSDLDLTQEYCLSFEIETRDGSSVPLSSDRQIIYINHKVDKYCSFVSYPLPINAGRSGVLSKIILMAHKCRVSPTLNTYVCGTIRVQDFEGTNRMMEMGYAILDQNGEVLYKSIKNVLPNSPFCIDIREDLVKNNVKFNSEMQFFHTVLYCDKVSMLIFNLIHDDTTLSMAAENSLPPYYYTNVKKLGKIWSIE